MKGKDKMNKIVSVSYTMNVALSTPLVVGIQALESGCGTSVIHN